MNKFISIIIPMYNLETYISDCVQSVLEQTYPYFEVLLIDDGSEDHTWEQCVKMQEQDSRIRIFRQDRKGVSCARNRGLDEACGEYLVFLDGDDMLHPAFLEEMLKRACQTGADMVGCNYFTIPTEKVQKEISSNFRDSFSGQWISMSAEQVRDSFYKASHWGLNMVTCKLIKKELIESNEKIYRFVPGVSLGEDTLFMYELVQKGFNLELTDVRAYLYRMHGESATHTWENYINKEKDPFFIHKKLRDCAYRDGEMKYAEKWENSYLSALRARYHRAKKDGQKEVCARLREEADQAMKSRYFNKSKVLYSLTFHISPLYWTCSFISRVLRKLMRGII